MAAILLLATVAFGLQVVSISSNTASPADAELGDQNAGLASGVLDAAVANDTLDRSLRYWNQTNGSFHRADERPEDGGHYIARLPQHAEAPAFGPALDRPFAGRQVRYNVDLYYENASGNGSVGHQPLVESGTPGDGAVRVVETVTLYDHDRLLAENGSRENATLGAVADDPEVTFYAPDASPDGPLYNVIRIEVVLWKP